MSRDAYTVVGAGAIGGTLAHCLARAGHPVTVVDGDPEHVAAIRAHGLTVTRGAERYAAVRVRAVTPEEFDGSAEPGEPPLQRVLLAVKAQATEDAVRWIAPRLAGDGYVVSLQNGFNEPLIARHIGPERTVAAFVDLFADVVEPGVIRDGGVGALVVGEPAGEPGGGPGGGQEGDRARGGAVSARVRRLVADLQSWGPAEASDNVEGYLWAKAGFGAMLAATALADGAMADLIDRHRDTMDAVAREVFDVADALGVRLEPFDAFAPQAFRRGADPGERDAAARRLTAWLRTMPKDRSGIWRDLAVRRRPVEVTTHYATVFDAAERTGADTPVLREVLAELRELEVDPAGMAEARLDRLDRLTAGPPDASGVPDAAGTVLRTPRRLPEQPSLEDARARSVREWLERHREEMVEDLAAYTELESPSDDPAALEECLRWLRGWLDRRLGAPDGEELLARDGAGDVLIRRYAGTRTGTTGPAGTDAASLLLLCHYDTVWPAGTLAERPFRREDDVLTGPGVFDMKAGLVQAVWALRALDALQLPRPACTLLLNGDEETGSLASSDTIAAEAHGADAALVFEASADGAVKTARKGVGLFTLTVHGREAHAGLDPDAGASAVDEIARQILRLGELRDPAAGTGLNAGVVRGGTRSNVTAGRASADLDVRVATDAERERITAALAALTPTGHGTECVVTGDWNRPVFGRTPGVAALYALARACAHPLGLDLREAAVGGASDGNFAQAAGTPVLDGLGAVGGGAHARDEHATVSGMVERAALAAGVVTAFA